MSQIDLVEVCGTRPLIRPPWCRQRFVMVPVGESLTQQSHADSVDVNRIIERFDRTGQLPLATREPVYADVTRLQEDFTVAVERSRSVISEAERFVKDYSPVVPPVPPVPPADSVLPAPPVVPPAVG